MHENLSIQNAKAVILSSLINGQIPSAEACHLTIEEFGRICEELYSEGHLMRTNLGNVLNAEVSNKGYNFLHTITEA
ncbi:hypothetical protein [Metabacillus halosaccharovorans]|uniref:hypothetical protein n=1 Tax=Metabacillus halosaccharovorans TaxID=930124 RepID=UPI00203FA9A5|nr:hypothetical protein [Metabacillus halosaccharovorans]MCM3443377.1 hypothetical protein [Metabacillus halosaccharovorans]